MKVDTGKVDIFSSDGHGNILEGYFGTGLDFDQRPVPCGEEELRKDSQRQCLEWPYQARLEIQHTRKQAGSCYKVTWSALTSGFYPQDCFLLQGAHWYGGAEVFEQHWPIETQKSQMQPFLGGDFLDRDTILSGLGKYGPILEPYWISSKGAGLHVANEVPLHVSFNEDDNEELCLMSNPESFIHPSKHATYKPALTYTICTAANIKEVHQMMSSNFINRPTGIPDKRMLKSPIWSTWARYKMDINENDTLQYAKEIKEKGFSNSQIEIDDMYTTTYGDMEWDTKKFPNVTQMMDNLHKMGYRVTSWTHPFVNTDSKAFKEALKEGYFLHESRGKAPGLVQWWQGIGGVLDPTNPEAVKWFTKNLEDFRESCGMDSFKFDSGEINYTPEYYHANQDLVNPNDFTTAYNEFVALLGGMVEVRAAYKSQHLPIFVRMLDKLSRWDYYNGLRSVIPTALLMSTLGYHFILPDMIGGNAYSEDQDLSKTILPDRELFIRWVALSAYLPSMQFSVAPWQYDDKVTKISRDYVKVHEEVVTPIVIKAAEEAISSGTPIIRPLWWLDPNDENNLVLDTEFLVGDQILVAPILDEGETERDIYLPAGRWKDNLRGGVLSGQTWLRNYEIRLYEIATFDYVP